MMKKFTLLSLTLVLAFSVFGQVNSDLPKIERKFVKENVQIELVKYNKYQDYQDAVRAYGDTIAYDDFSSGSTSQLPTGWTSVDIDSQGNNYLWEWTNVGAQGPTTGGYEHVLASTSAANGWVIFDSDNYGQGSYDAFLYSPVYNCSAFSAVAISWEELYQRWGNESTNPYSGNPTFVGVSIDGGTTYTEFEIHADFAVKDATDNPDYYMLNISSLAGSQASVKFYFRMQGLWDYWWQIDDFMVMEGPHHNLTIADTYTTAAVDYGTGYGFYGFYSKMPQAQIIPMFFQADVINNGVDQQTNVSLAVNIDQDGTNVYSQTADTIQLNFMDTASLIPAMFEAQDVGTYTADYAVSQTQTEEVPEDNVAGPFSWEVTNNKIMARDVTYTRGLSPEHYVGGLSGDLIGVSYYIPNTDTLESISVFIDYRTDPTGNTMLYGQVLEESNGSWVVKAETDEYYITAADLGQWINLPIVSAVPGDDILEGDNNYRVGLEFYWTGEEDLWIGAEDEGPHLYSRTSYARIGTDWGWIDVMPMIRLNLNNAIVAPQFKMDPATNVEPMFDVICQTPNLDAMFDLTFKVEDPNALPVSIDTVDVPSFVTSFSDNGDNTYTLGFDLTGVDTSSTMSYNFEIIADNGYAQNTLFFNSTVEIVPGCIWSVDNSTVAAPEVSIYPNPTTGTVNIENAENATIVVYNLIGEEVISIEKADQRATVNLNDYAEGTYIVKVITANDVVSKKINLVK